jgi:hypothetical protein
MVLDPVWPPCGGRKSIRVGVIDGVDDSRRLSPVQHGNFFVALKRSNDFAGFVRNINECCCHDE